MSSPGSRSSDDQHAANQRGQLGKRHEDRPDRSSGVDIDPQQSAINRKIIRFTEIATCGDEVWIEHEGKLYRLQSTKQGKLVLTK